MRGETTRQKWSEGNLSESEDGGEDELLTRRGGLIFPLPPRPEIIFTGGLSF
jgi:hypothetical protein